MSANQGVELRNFATNAIYAAGAGIMPGGNINFMAAAVIRILGTASAQHDLFTNYTGTTGWRISRLVDTVDDAGAAVAVLAVEVRAASIIQATIQIRMAEAVGRTYMVVLENLTESTNGVINLYANGGFVATATAAVVAAVSASTAQIGGHNAGTPALHEGVLSCGYTTDFTPGQATQAALFLEALKRGELSAMEGVTWQYLYSAARDSAAAGGSGSGYPRTLTNYGTAAPAGNMPLVGVGSVVVGTPPIVWGALGEFTAAS